MLALNVSSLDAKLIKSYVKILVLTARFSLVLSSVECVRVVDHLSPLEITVRGLCHLPTILLNFINNILKLDLSRTKRTSQDLTLTSV